MLVDAVYPYHRGGRETLHRERSTRLARLGQSVRVLTAHWWPEPDRELVRDGVALHAIGPRVRMYTTGGRRSIWQTVVFGVSSLRLFWAPTFDVLDVDQFPFVHFFVARLVCRIRRKPMTATWHEVWDDAYWREYIGRLGRIGAWLQRAAARQADLVFANSTLTATRLSSWLGIDPQRVIILPPVGIESLPDRDSQPKTVDCIFIGRLLAHKHVDVFLRALAQLPNVTGIVIGSGPELPRLQRLARELSVSSRVSFDESATYEATIGRLRAARLLVSLSTREGFGMTVFEASACGVPALIVNHPDNAALELVRDGENGMICELDPATIASRIRAFLADPAAQQRMSIAARQSASSYSWESHVFRMLSALESLRPSKPRPPRAGEGQAGASRRAA